MRLALTIPFVLAGLALTGGMARGQPQPPTRLPPPGRSEFFVFGEGPVLPAFPVLRYRSGDNPRWADPAADDRDWEERRYADGLPSRTGIYWVRFNLRQPARPDRLRDGMSIAVVASYEIFVDGRRVGRNGVVGATREAEVPGYVDNIFRLPDALLTPGNHLVAMRMSAWHSGFPSPRMTLNLAAADYASLIQRRVRLAMYSLVALGGAIAVGLGFALLWLLVDRRRPLLLFAGLGFGTAILQALQAWRWLFYYPFDWHYPRLVAIALLMGLLGLLLNAALQDFFGLRHRGWWLGALLTALIGIWLAGGWNFYDTGAAMLVLAVAVALGISIWAVWRRQSGALLVAAGLLVSFVALLGNPNEYLGQLFFVSFGVPILGCLGAVGLRLRDERRAAQQSRLMTARLEIELLKKNIQPHFLLNTLTALSEVVERDPASAVRLINDLAGEFRSLARMSGEKLVPLGQELELCRAHLRVLDVRTGRASALETREVDEASLVPPALFLTLIENAFMHQRPAAGAVPFVLRMTRLAGRVGYTFFSPGAVKPAPGRPDGGTGLRYVKARLEESFPRRWTLDQHAVPEGWETVIEIQTT